MKTTRALAGAIVSLCLVAPAQAAPGWYLSIEGGGKVVGDWDHTRTKMTWCGPEVKEALAAFETGYAAFGAAGYAIDAWRVEVEGGFRMNDVESYEKSSKRRTYVVDATGELKAMVTAFTQAATPEDRDALVTQIIYRWAGVQDVNPTSRASRMIYGNAIGDARKLEALEEFMGEEWVGVWCWGASSTPRPWR